MSELIIDDLHVEVAGSPILKGFSLTVRSGEVHAVMGPNGSGKSTLSHALMGKPGYDVTRGSVQLDGQELLDLAPWQRAQAGLFLAMQHPIEVPGVSLEETLGEALAAQGRADGDVHASMMLEAERIGFGEQFLTRPLNVDLSGGEKKRNETLQLGVLEPRFAVLDEIDSGLDVDALAAVSRRIEAATTESGLGVIAITHFNRLLEELRPDRVHVLAGGSIQASGGPELATELERDGYAKYLPEVPSAATAEADPFADPFADPLL